MKLEDELKTKFTSNGHKAMLNILFTGNWLHNKMETVLKPYGLSHQQYNVLRILRGSSPNAVNLRDISERMVDKMSNATRLVEKLRIKGLLTREICPENRRKVEIMISKKGLELLEKLDDKLKVANQEVLSKISEEESGLINDLLEKIRA